jgi:hypothetical protein
MISKNKRISNLNQYISPYILAYQEIYEIEPPVMEKFDILRFEGKIEEE